MNEQYQVVMDTNRTYRVIFADGSTRRDEPRFETQVAARAWAEEILGLEAQGREILASLAE
jgi:hypothetical protein